MLSHLSLGVSSLERSGAFYDAIGAVIGFERVWESPRGIGYGPPGKNDKLAVIQVDDARPSPRFHLAFPAADPDAVHRFHAAALASGGGCDGEPGPRPHYGETYYAAFVTDPDGHRLEAVHQ